MSFLKLSRQASKEEQPAQLSMFSPFHTLDLEYTISAISSNLILNCKSCAVPITEREGCKFTGLIGIVSKGILQVYELDMSSDGQLSSRPVNFLQPPNVPNPLIRPSIVTAAWLVLRPRGGRRSESILVLTTSLGISVYSEDGGRVLGMVEYPESGAESVCRSVAATHSQILLGNGRGEVHILDFNEAGKVYLRATMKAQTEPITRLYCGRHILVTGSPSGAVHVWKLRGSKAAKLYCFRTQWEECVTEIRVWESCVIVSYGSGVVRIYELTCGRLVARVMAHGRWIVSMDLLAHQGLLLTVAEDDAMVAWQLKIEASDKHHLSKSHGSIRTIKSRLKTATRQKSHGKRKQPKVSIQLVSLIRVDNMLLVGGKFLTCSGNIIAASNYGAKEVYFYKRQNFVAGETLKESS